MSKSYCPSCNINWTVPDSYMESSFHLLCAFCSKHPSEESLIDFQMDNLEFIDTKDYPKLMRRLYRLIKRELNGIK